MEYTAPSVPSFRSPSPSSMSWGSIPSALSPTASKSHFYSTGGLISVLGLLLDFINLLTVIVEKNLTELTFFSVYKCTFIILQCLPWVLT